MKHQPNGLLNRNSASAAISGRLMITRSRQQHAMGLLGGKAIATLGSMG